MNYFEFSAGRLDLPLIELHCHLDGSITSDIARKLAAVQGIDLPNGEEELSNLISVPSSCQSLDEFLKCFDLPVSLLQTKETLSLAVKLVAEKMKSCGVVYAEIRFAPQLHCKKGLSQLDAVKAVLEGAKNSPIHINIILCMMRGENTHRENFEVVEIANKLIQDAKKTRNSEGIEPCVVAIDLAGSEAFFPCADYKEEFELAKKYGIPCTIHAGEAAGSESVWTAIKCGAKRIGHGVRSCDDETLMDYLAENQIALEMAPTSNMLTKTVGDMKDYPIRKFLERGIAVTVNTDDPAVCRTDLKSEFDFVSTLCNFTKDEKKIMLLNAAKNSFACDKVKSELCSLIEKI